MYLCPVCGYDRLDAPPEDFNVCPACGTEFGYHDFAVTQDDRHAQWERLRRRWLARRAPWFSPVIPPPLGWNAYAQLFRADLAVRHGADDVETTNATWMLAVA